MNGLYEQGLISSILLNNYKKELEERISNLKIIKSKIKASRINLSSNLNLPIDLIMSMKIALEDSKTATIEEKKSEEKKAARVGYPTVFAFERCICRRGCKRHRR